MSDALARYDEARVDLVAQLSALEPLLSGVNRDGVHRARTRLARATFVLAVVGEFSSGKSFLLNALLGKVRYEDAAGSRTIGGLLAVDINPSTAAITELEGGASDEAHAWYESGRSERIPLDVLNRFVAVGKGDTGTLHDATGDRDDTPVKVVITSDSPFLARGFTVADTPGLASINPAHRRATLAFLPSADAVLYLIDTQQPFTEGDAAFLGIVRRHIDSIFIVQTKIDLWMEPQADGRPAWEHAHQRIERMAAVHAPDTFVFPVSAREYARGLLDGDPSAIRASRFPALLEALDDTLIKRTGFGRLRRACQAAQTAAVDERTSIERDLAMLALDERALREARAEALPQVQVLMERSSAERTSLLERGRMQREMLEERGRVMAEDLERDLSLAFDTADVARLRDRERLHGIVDRVVARVVGDFAQTACSSVVAELDAALERACALVSVRWSANDTAAKVFGAQPGTSFWSGNVADALGATIVFEAIGGPAIGLVFEIGSRFAGHPPGTYMKRELVSDLRGEILPRLRAEVEAFVGRIGSCLERLYDDLAETLGRSALSERDARLGAIESALQARSGGRVRARESELTARRDAIARQERHMADLLSRAISAGELLQTTTPNKPAMRAAHAEASFDRNAYGRGLRPERWRVAILGALRRGKSGLVNAIAGRQVLSDDVAGSARFPIHVRYGEREQAFALEADGRWSEIPYAESSSRAAETPVLVLVPWDLPHELVLVHTPAFDSGEPDAEDANVAVASHASEVLCLFSRQLSDRELDLFERVSEFGRPMLFVHTLADNESPSERRHVVELAAQYLRERHVAFERIFVVSAKDEDEARLSVRPRAAWNEMPALRATIAGHAETHMARLERLAKIHASPADPAAPSAEPPAASKPQRSGFLARLIGKGH